MRMAKLRRPVLVKLAVTFAAAVALLGLVIFGMPFLGWFTTVLVLKPSGCHMKVWVKVVDQSGDAVENYNMEATGLKNRLIPFGEEDNVYLWGRSDANGLIYFDSKTLVKRMFYGNYLAELECGNNVDYLPSKDNVNLSCDDLNGSGQQRNNLKWGGLGIDRAHPILVKVYRHGPPQRILRGEVPGYDKKPDQMYFSVDLVKGEAWLSSGPEGDLAFRHLSTEEYRRQVPDAEPNQEGSEVVTAADGGVQLVMDGYAVTPPEDGYTQHWVYPRDYHSNRYRNWTELYFYCRNRRYYGYLTTSTVTRVLYIINLDGQRNLYYEGYPSTDSVVMKNFVRPPVECDPEEMRRRNTERNEVGS